VENRLEKINSSKKAQNSQKGKYFFGFCDFLLL